MAKSPTEKAPKAPAQEFVTKEEFNTLTGSVSDLVNLIKSGALNATPATTPEAVAEEKAIKQADPNKYTVNHSWEEIAQEVIGAAVDHTEVQYIKGGGTLFTVVVKADMSNASNEYMERHGVDRRSKEIGMEGDAGVRLWCEQVRNNLKRQKPVNMSN